LRARAAALPRRHRDLGRSGLRSALIFCDFRVGFSASPAHCRTGARHMNMSQAENLAHRVVSDMGGAFTMALAYVGDQLGLYKAMCGAGPMTSEELAAKTGLNERYVREWLKAMVAAEYLDYNPIARKFLMTE